MKTRLCAFVLLMLALAMPCVAESIQVSLDEQGTLTLSGSGTVDSTVLTQLTDEELARVTDVVIEEGITGLDSYALERVSLTLRSVTIPSSVTWVGTNILGAKGALDYTIYGKPETLRELLSGSNEDYGYFCRFEEAVNLPDVAASQVVSQLVGEMADWGIDLTLQNAQEKSDNHGHVRYEYAYVSAEGSTVTLTSFDGEQIKKATVVTETLTPSAEWEGICRSLPQTQALGLTDGIRTLLAEIELQNGGGNVNKSADGWEIRVGGVMDTRTAWDLTKQDAYEY